MGPTVLTPKPNPSQFALFMLLVLPLSIGNVNNGQSNPLILGLLLAALPPWWRAAGTCAACIAAVPFNIYPIAIGLRRSPSTAKLGTRALATGRAGPAIPAAASELCRRQYGIWIDYLPPRIGGFAAVRDDVRRV